jgi:hypothetical protein
MESRDALREAGTEETRPQKSRQSRVNWCNPQRIHAADLYNTTVYNM